MSPWPTLIFWIFSLDTHGEVRRTLTKMRLNDIKNVKVIEVPDVGAALLCSQLLNFQVST